MLPQFRIRRIRILKVWDTYSEVSERVDYICGQTISSGLLSNYNDYYKIKAYEILQMFMTKGRLIYLTIKYSIYNYSLISNSSQTYEYRFEHIF